GVEQFHGSGAVAVLIFGMVLANGETILGLFHPRMRDRVAALFATSGVVLHPRIAESHAEVSFLVRSFFFVYLGVIFRWPGADMRLWLATILIIVAVLAARGLAVQLLGWTTRVSGANRHVLQIMLPRGLATAVLMFLLEKQTGDSSGTWLSLAMFVVVATNLWMTAHLIKLSRTPRGEAKRAVDEGVGVQP
ncbi:MAG: cation:proton antiporter, partial [Planctomycetota bacterium]